MQLLRRRVAATALLFLFGLAIPLAGGYYSKNVSSKESNKGELAFPPDPDPKKKKPAEIDIAKFATPKKVVQPWSVRIYTAVVNKSKEPRRVGVTLEGCQLPARWHVTDYTWDEITHAIQEPLPPGKKFGVYIFFTIPEEMRTKPVICEGMLKALDPDTGKVLATLPVKLKNSAAGPAPAPGKGNRGSGDETPLPDGAIHNH